MYPFPKSLRIGPLEIAPATVLAPMAGVTDTVFRRFIREMGGCGLMMTEFTSADGVLRSKDKQDTPDPPSMIPARGCDMVDLNRGCPAKKVVKCNGGSGLLRDLPLIGKIFETVRAAVTIPFTVKFRAGWNDKELV